MKCQRCNGTGYRKFMRPPRETLPCPDCMGTGVEDCCHGHEGQPEEDEE